MGDAASWVEAIAWAILALAGGFSATILAESLSDAWRALVAALSRKNARRA